MVKTRFAPSPTAVNGYGLHQGSLHTALFAYAFAKKNNGIIQLRIEDSDPSRSNKECLVSILKELEWLGIHFDEGPTLQDVINDKFDERYFQSKRNHIYTELSDRLLKEGKAYIQDGSVIFRMPQKNWAFDSLVMGHIEFPADSQKDFLIRRSDGSHIFHFVNVVDDILAGMTHLVKGADHISNTPKHLALFEAFNAKIPTYVFLPLIFDEKGQKLSKRRTDQLVMIKDFIDQGFLKETLINYISLLGWSAPDGRELFDLDYLCSVFDFNNCTKANPRFDYKKLVNTNQQYIQKLSSIELTKVIENYGKDKCPDQYRQMRNLHDMDQWLNLISLYRPRIKTIKEFFEITKFFYNQPSEYSEKLDIELLQKIKDQILSTEFWTLEVIQKHLSELVQQNNLKIGQVCKPIRIAIAGQNVSPELDKTLMILGRGETIRRITNYISLFEKDLVTV